jgi:4-hydroxybutyrate CoA-transferase
MTTKPRSIQLDDIGPIIAERFRTAETVTCYVGSNAATPTASLEALTETVKARQPELPFLKMVHLLLQGPVPYVEPGLQDRIMAYSVFSSADVRKAANEGRAYYIPCTLANLENLIKKGCRYEPDVAILKVTPNPYTGELSLGLSVEALHTAIDRAKLVIAELDPSMPYTQGHSAVNARSIDYLIEDGVTH